jgi:hypothetical protein
MTGVAAGRVAPFGHPGITARLQLPQAYRSLPRPSSPLDAKASTVCLIAFDLKFDIAAPRAGEPRPVLIPHTRPALASEPSSIRQLSKSVDEIPTRPRGERFRIRQAKRDVSKQRGVRATSETLSAPSEEGLTRDLQKGGDPAAGSPTATLLRLRPSH